MDNQNVELLEKVAHDYLERVLNHESDDDELEGRLFKRAMEASDRLLEQRKLEQAFEEKQRMETLRTDEQIRADALEKKKMWKDVLIGVAIPLVTGLGLKIVDHFIFKSEAIMIGRDIEQFESFTSTPGKNKINSRFR